MIRLIDSPVFPVLVAIFSIVVGITLSFSGIVFGEIRSVPPIAVLAQAGSVEYPDDDGTGDAPLSLSNPPNPSYEDGSNEPAGPSPSPSPFPSPRHSNERPGPPVPLGTIYVPAGDAMTEDQGWLSFFGEALKQGPWFMIVLGLAVSTYWAARWTERNVLSPLTKKFIGDDRTPGYIDRWTAAFESSVEETKTLRREYHEERRMNEEWRKTMLEKELQEIGEMKELGDRMDKLKDLPERIDRLAQEIKDIDR